MEHSTAPSGSKHIPKTNISQFEAHDCRLCSTRNHSVFHDFPIDVKYEPLDIKDEFPSTNIMGETTVNVNSEESNRTRSNDDIGEPKSYSNYEYDIKQESNDFAERDHSTATSGSKFIATTNISQFEAHDCCSISSTRKHDCDICRQHLCKEKDRIAHRYIHTEDENFKCLICQNTFDMKQHLNRHMLNIHTNVSVFHDFPTDVKYEPLNIKVEFPSTNIMGETTFNVQSENSRRTPNNDDTTEPNVESHTNYIKQESNDFAETGKFTATSGRTNMSPFEAQADRFSCTQILDCDICQQHFARKEDRIAHRYTHTEDENFKCLICRNTFHMKNYLNRHIINSHPNLSRFQCGICHKLFTRKNNLATHKRIHIGVKPYGCDICNKSFSVKQYLTVHKSIHSGEKPYKCDICNKSFTQKRSLISHKRTHSGEKPYECDICNKSFRLKKTLTIHKSVHTGAKPYECDICNKSFSLKQYLTIHKHTHSGEKPYECDICNTSFKLKQYLTIHKRTHSGEKPYECDICNKSFSLKKILTIHKRTHSGEKPYECDICNKSFSIKRTLTDHKRTHSGEKPYECDICNKSFSIKRTLTDHKRTHSGEKPYECDICNTSFTQKGSLISHKRTHSNKKPYECDI